MKYVVLLRGINVGGNNKISMGELKQALLDAGFRDVVSYINSGNVVLSSEMPTDAVNSTVAQTITQTFGLDISTLTLTKPDYLRIAKALPANWTNNSEMRCDCFFLWQGVDTADILDSFTVKPDIDQVMYVPGAVFWSVDRKNVTRSGLAKIIGTTAYKQMTIRNANTVRKLITLLT